MPSPVQLPSSVLSSSTVVPDGPVRSGSSHQASAIDRTVRRQANDDSKNDMVDLSQDSTDDEEEQKIVDFCLDDDDEDDDNNDNVGQESVKPLNAPSNSSISTTLSPVRSNRIVTACPELVKSEPQSVARAVASRNNNRLEMDDEESAAALEAEAEAPLPPQSLRPAGDDEEEEDGRKPAAIPDRQEMDDIDQDSTNPFRERRSGVSGYGMFRSFKRIFKTGFMAMLDLFDNAVDATIGRPGGYIACLRDHDDPATVIMYNNSDQPIIPVNEIMNINQSSKRDREEDVGENGVGVKQACGYLSNLSFVLTKNKRQFSIGILSYELQTDDQPVLPSYVLPDLSDRGSLYMALEDLKNRHTAFEQSLKSWGGGNANIGLTFLLNKMRILRECDDDYMFCLVVVKISMDPEQLILDLQDKLPLYYIHIPSTLSIKINGQLLKGKYWERRLVDLTVASVQISKKEVFYEDPRWQDPTDAYTLRIYLGFDVKRARARLDSQLSMFIYSRKTGRLIKKERDARHILGLSGTGSDFCAGFTVIVDDFTSQLELSPSKQDLIFQDYENEVGENHEKNLYAWIGTWCHHVYKTHEKAFGEKKRLGDTVASLAIAFPNEEPTFSLSSGVFNRFLGMSFAVYQATGKIRVRRSEGTLQLGRDVVQLKPSAPPPHKPPKAVTRTPSTRDRKPGRPLGSIPRNRLTQEDDETGAADDDRIAWVLRSGNVESTTGSRKRRFSDRDDSQRGIGQVAEKSANDVIDEEDEATGILGPANFEILQLKNRVANLLARNHQLTEDIRRLHNRNNDRMGYIASRLKEVEDKNIFYIQRIQLMENMLAQQKQIISLQSQGGNECDPLQQLQAMEQEFGLSL